MNKLNTEGSLMEKPSSIWITIASIIVAFAVALASLQGGRETNAQSIEDLKSNYTTINQKLDLLNEKVNQSNISQAEVKTDINYIKSALVKIQDK